MEQITTRDGALYYGEHECKSVDEAYACFRSDYHRSLGRDASRRLNRLGKRRERVRGYGFVFAEGEDLQQFDTGRRIDAQFLGLVGISYARSIGVWSYKHISDSDFDAYLDWVFARGKGNIRTIGVNDKVGRTRK